ncbi:MAG: decaprenyl-phosphate phosphoribosyltransferase [Patescibacteria group bacterium]|nr:decaprenyl-phosphate phosphoribosyltransferase [Patescibacteria group bacterium]
MDTLMYLVRSVRPRQWIKNTAVFAAVIFAGEILTPSKSFPVLYTFFIFCGLTSASYLINDVIDIKRDRIHYFKKNRPIASGKLSPKIALCVAAILLGISAVASYFLSIYLFVLVLGFMIIQLSYSLFFKHLILLDIIAIAGGFMLRVFAGALVVPISLSSWLILSTMMLALFLAIGKRRLEVTLLDQKVASEHRQTLSHYPLVLLDGLTFMMAIGALITYSFFTFNEPQIYHNQKFLSFLPETMSSPKWLMVSIPLVVYGIFRYLYLIYEKKEGESPERVLLHDLPLLISVVLWAGLVIAITHFL